MFLISWNVASWATTSKRIRESYGTIEYFFSLTHADVICLQETKISKLKLQKGPHEAGAADIAPPKPRTSSSSSSLFDPFDLRINEPLSPSTAWKSLSRHPPAGTSPAQKPNGTGIHGWESFWAHSGEAFKGRNGVATFARQGLVHACDSAPFTEGDAILNDEGRCVVVWLSHVIIVNTYVPNAQGGAREEHKNHFLAALQRLLERLSTTASIPSPSGTKEDHPVKRRSVVLAGDLNLSYRSHDSTWWFRRIELAELLCLQARVEAATKESQVEEGERKSHDSAPLFFVDPHYLQEFISRVTYILCPLVKDAIKRTKQNQQPPPASQRFDSSSKCLPNIPPPPPPEPPTDFHDHLDSTEVSEFDLAKLEELDQRLESCGASRGLPTSYDTSGALDKNSKPLSPIIPLSNFIEAGFGSLLASRFIQWTSAAMNYPAKTNWNQEVVYPIVQYAGLPPHSDASIQWISRLLHEPLPSGISPRAQRPLTPSSLRLFDSLLITNETLMKASTPSALTYQPGSRNDTLLLQPEPRHCPLPFTCWDQMRNRRSNNEGTRIDYILVGTELAHCVVPCEDTSNNTGRFPSVEPPPPPPKDAEVTSANCRTSEEAQFWSYYSLASSLPVDSPYAASVARATGARRYVKAPLDGSGLPPLAPDARKIMWYGLPSTGLVNTPPQFSDHIGVCVLLREREDNLERWGSEMPRAQPRKQAVVDVHPPCYYPPPRNLHSFFAAMAKPKPSPSSCPNEVQGRGEKRASEGHSGASEECQEKKVKIDHGIIDIDG